MTGLTHPSGTYWMRSNISQICSLVNQSPDALAAIYYDNTSPDQVPKSKAWDVPDDGTCANDDLSLTQPYYSIAPVGANADTTFQYDISFHVNGSGINLWWVNNRTFRADYNSPILLLANQGNFSFDPLWNVYDFGTNESITFVINNPTGLPSHPMHMHGHNFWVLSEGPGTWDGKTIMGNPKNPQRRDVQLLPGGHHLVLQIKTDNPGAWPLHCHIAWHVSSGLYITILERPDEIPNMQIPQVMVQTCKE